MNLSTFWQPWAKNEENAVISDAEESPKFGTFLGVFVPCILMLFGVIIFLRLGWILGQVGLFTSIFILTFAALIALITGLSMSSICTNIKVGKGGVYYVLSRSLGVEVGSAIGIPLFLKQSLTIAFCVIGFAESLNDLIPSWPIQTIGICTLAVLTILALFSIKGALKVQLAIFVAIMASLISLFTGSAPAELMQSSTFTPKPLESADFWVVFALFFPAMTGLESGVSLSGDLRNPGRSLPIGSISAVLMAYLVYVFIALFLASIVPMDRLAADPLIMQDIASIPSLIIVGIWGATLSSALGALLGAPRTLQAIADDGIIPSFFGKTFGAMKEPRVATFVTFLIAFGGIYFGSVNIIAPMLTMICLICYAVLNVSAGIETLMGNPSWRPRFYVHWSISMIGAAACVVTMLMINVGCSLLSFLLVSIIYMIVKKRRLHNSWGDIRYGILHYFTRFAVYQMASFKNDFKSWRPHFLVFAKSSVEHSTSLMQFSDAINQSKSFLTIATFVSKENETSPEPKAISETLRKGIKKQNIQVFVKVRETDNITSGMKQMIENYGLGPLTPNTIVFGGIKKEDKTTDFVDILRTAVGRRCNVVIVNDANYTQPNKVINSSEIHIWWCDEHKNNSEFMLVLATLLQKNPAWKKARVSVKAIVSNEFEKQEKIAQLQTISVEKRLPLDIEVFVATRSDAYMLIKKFSSHAAIALLSLNPPPKCHESNLEYIAYLNTINETFADFPSLTLVLGSEHTPLNSILK